jgi:pyruvate/2-oxoglutarate dehydrogenase complex dihydrolipoamide acyltransferase (E2) component
MGVVTMRSLVIALVAVTALVSVAALAGSAAGQPAPAAPAAAPAAPTAAPAVPADAAPVPAAPAKLTREQIIEALAQDKALEEDFVRQLKARHALELNATTRQRHDDDARQIALNKRHVVLAYAALWILSVLFLVVLWRRQQTMNARIAQLQKELDAAVASNK